MLESFEQAVWFLTVGCQAVLLVRLQRLGLLTRYRWFACFLAIQIVYSGALFPFARDSNAYGYIYVGGAVLSAAAAVLAIIELYGMVLRDYSGINSLGRWVVIGGFGVAILIALATLSPDLSNSADRYPKLLYLAIFQRGIYSALLVFMLIISAFIAWFPIPLSRNTVRHTVLFALMFSSTSLLLLIRNTFGYDASPYRLLSALEVTIHVICLIGWIVLLTREGEDKTMIVGHRWRPDESGRLVGQLDSINSSLLRSARQPPPG